MNKFFSFLKYSLCSKGKYFGLIGLGSKLETMFNFDNYVERDKATYIYPGKNVCLINSKETTVEENHDKFNGNWVLLKVLWILTDNNTCINPLSW